MRFGIKIPPFLRHGLLTLLPATPRLTEHLSHSRHPIRENRVARVVELFGGVQEIVQFCKEAANDRREAFSAQVKTRKFYINFLC
jgi:hypothetical protein